MWCVDDGEVTVYSQTFRFELCRHLTTTVLQADTFTDHSNDDLMDAVLIIDRQFLAIRINANISRFSLALHNKW